MTYVSRTGEAGLAARARRIAAAPRAPVAAAALLALLALAELAARYAAGTGSLGRLMTAGSSVSQAAPAGGGTAPAVHTVLAPTVSVQALLVLCVLCLATTLPLGLLWGQPTAAALAVTAATTVSLALFGLLTAAGVAAQLAAGCRLGRVGPQPLAVALALPFLVLALAGHPGGEAGALAVVLASLVPAAAWAGSARGARRDAVAHTAARRAIEGTLLENTARGERARISRELHDVVAHHISMIAVQAETARLSTAGMPPAGAQRLRAIGDTARAALTEMRRLLGVLREDAAPAEAGRRPQPGLRQLTELIDEARDASGAGVRLILRGAPVPLGPGTELAAYRIVQEALTNARRHAPGAAVDVELHYCGNSLRLRIRDNGPGPPLAPQPGGHGLLGMRERAAAAGGELRAAAAAGGGFLITACLPGEEEPAR
jgi:signal transduction histidine kinase